MNMRKIRNESKFIKYMKAPIRILTRIRDLYVQSLTGVGDHVGYGNAMGCPTPHIPNIPRSFSTNSSIREQDLKELIRLASTRDFNGKIEAELRRSKPTLMGGGGMAPPVNRSNTVVIGRIDEDKPFEFGENDAGLLRPMGVPRSKSHALSRMR